MEETMTVLSPEGQVTAAQPHAALAPRLSSLAGRSIALLSNNKPGAQDLLAGFRSVLEAHGAGSFVEAEKPGPAMPNEELSSIAPRCDAAVVALGD